MEQHAVEIRCVEPQPTALLAVEEDPLLSLGELGHLDVIARAIHGNWAPGGFG